MFNGSVPTRLFVLATSLVLAACTQAPPASHYPSTPSPATNTSNAIDAASSISPTTGSSSTPRTLTIGATEEPDTLNPYFAALFTSFKVALGVMDPLVNMDKDLNFVPGLAESWTVSPDGLTYRFNLRKGVKWHDGVPFTAADVVATKEVLTDPKAGAFFSAGYEKVDKIITPDDHTVIMVLKEPYAPFLAVTAGWPVAPKHWIDKGEAFKTEFGRHPIGTGPFKFVSWSSAQEIVLTRNLAYFLPTPDIDKIIFRIVPDTKTLMLQLRTGEIQMADSLGATDYDAIKAIPGVDVRLSTGLTYMHIDLKNTGALMDKRVRQALDFATPKHQIVEQLLKGLGTVAVADQSPVTAYFDPTIKARPYDMDKAAALLAEAGYKKNTSDVYERAGAPLRIDYWVPSGDQTAKLVSQVIVASWRKLGVTVIEHEAEPRVFLTPDGFYFNKDTTAGQWDWTMLPDPDTRFFWHSEWIPKEAGGPGLNVNAFFNKWEKQAEFDALTDAGEREINVAQRKQIYNDLQALLHEEVPSIFLYWSKRIFVSPTWLKYETNAGMPLLYNVYSWRVGK